MSHFWKDLHEEFRTKENFSMPYRPQTDGQTERTNQVLEDMLRACIIDLKGSWDDNISLNEFSYNNNYQASIKMDPFEALYGRKYRSPVCWNDIGDKENLGPEVLQETVEVIDLIRK